MELKPVNSINNDANTIRVSDGNSPIRLIFKDAKGEVINLYDKIDYFYLTKDNEKFYSVTDISYDGDEVIIRLPKLRKGKYKAEIRDKDGSIYPANEDLYILLRRSFEDDKDIYYFGHREDILNNVEPMVIQHIEKNPDKFRGERGQQGFPGRDGLPGIDGKDGKDGIDGEKGDPGKDGSMSFVDLTPEEKEQLRGERGRPGLDGKDGKDGKDGVNGINGKDGIDGINGKDGKDGSIDNKYIGVKNLIDISSFIKFSQTLPIDTYNIEKGIINFESLTWQMFSYQTLNGVKHAFRVKDYSSDPQYYQGLLRFRIIEVIDGVDGAVLIDLSVPKNKVMTVDLSGRETQKYRIELRPTGGTPLTGFIEKPMLVEGDIPVLWNYENDIDIDVSNKLDKQPTTIQYKIPTDFTTFYRCLEHIKDNIYSNGTTIKVLIESGHKPRLRAYFRNVDFSNVELHSEDAIVNISDALSDTQNMWDFGNSIAPNLHCLVNMGGIGNHGIFLINGSKVFVNSKCGVTHAGGDGLQARSGSTASVQFTIFTHAGQNITGNEERAGISAWGGRVNAHGANTSFSNHHGARAAYSGVLDFENGTSNECGFHGIRASNLGMVSCPGAVAKGNKIHGIYALAGSTINADRTDVSGTTGVGYKAIGGSIIHANLGVADNCKTGVESSRGSTINFLTGSCLNNETTGIISQHSSVVEARNVKINGSQLQGVVCEENSTANIQNCLIYGSKIVGLRVRGNSTVNASVSIIRTTAPGNINAHGVICEGISRINVGGSQVWNNGGNDLRVDSGGQIGARGTITTSGVISGSPNIETPQIQDVNLSAFNEINRAGIIFN